MTGAFVFCVGGVLYIQIKAVASLYETHALLS